MRAHPGMTSYEKMRVVAYKIGRETGAYGMTPKGTLGEVIDLIQWRGTGVGLWSQADLDVARTDESFWSAYRVGFESGKSIRTDYPPARTNPY